MVIGIGTTSGPVYDFTSAGKARCLTKPLCLPSSSPDGYSHESFERGASWVISQPPCYYLTWQSCRERSKRLTACNCGQQIPLSSLQTEMNAAAYPRLLRGGRFREGSQAKICTVKHLRVNLPAASHQSSAGASTYAAVEREKTACTQIAESLVFAI